jgi:hypothetical protein
MSWLVPELEPLSRTFPSLDLHLYFGSGPDLLLRVRTMEIDCAVTSSRFTDPKLDAIRLHREDYAFVGSTALLRKKPLGADAHAAQHTLLDASADLPLFRYFRDAPEGGDRLRFQKIVRLGSIEAIRRRALEGPASRSCPPTRSRAISRPAPSAASSRRSSSCTTTSGSCSAPTIAAARSTRPSPRRCSALPCVERRRPRRRRKEAPGASSRTPRRSSPVPGASSRWPRRATRGAGASARLLRRSSRAPGASARPPRASTARRRRSSRGRFRRCGALGARLRVRGAMRLSPCHSSRCVGRASWGRRRTKSARALRSVSKDLRRRGRRRLK